LHHCHVNDEPRLELRHYPSHSLASLKALGCFTEVIAYKTRLFVPFNRAEEILEDIGQAFAVPGAHAA
jgi:hypothetical protein